MVRHQVLVLAFGGSNPSALAKMYTKGDPNGSPNKNDFFGSHFYFNKHKLSESVEELLHLYQ